MPSPLVARTGQTQRGHPVSINLAPDTDLARHIARLFITIVEQPEEAVLEDFIVSETGFVRILLTGAWETLEEGGWHPYAGPVLFGAQSRPFRARVRGSFAMCGFAILPGAWRSLTGIDHHDLADRVQRVSGPIGDRLAQAGDDPWSHARTFAALNSVVRDWIRLGTGEIDAIAERFDQRVHLDPTRSVAELAREVGTTPRTLDRRIQAGFGMGPKLVLRRARFLDMAATVRGIAVPDEAMLAALRFYDQSHLVREFRHFTGMTPTAFERASTPLFNLALESRQRRKYELASRAGERIPWLA
ncbi:AraC family transcriptional regulator [Sphingomonas sp. Y38-1Y]|uniref:helix-turn-helix domain-containing protein n=1 Tax=Sphingomonas sp. Y38-1Y TaxID=3078265 RepID=UPI0028EDC643|nr:AraC family transcriptional regulator [Sphingomonas sp. Y38-1Y]